MRIVVLDGFTLNPGDLSWDGLGALGKLEVYDRTSPELTVERSKGAGAVVTNKVVFDAHVIGQLPKLRYIGVTATGYNIVDVEAARKHGVTVTNVPAYSTPSVAQMAFAHLLNFASRVQEHSQGARSGRWAASKDFAYWDHSLLELDGLTMGLVGFGRIAQATARMAQAFGMKVLAYARRPSDAPGVQFVDPSTLFAQSDVISLHVPLAPETAGMINREALGLMKPTAYLINASRGGLVVEQDLADALNTGKIAGAGLDVLSSEPPKADNPLLSARNCTITPHIAWATQAARGRLLNVTTENLRAFLAGKAVNVVA